MDTDELDFVSTDATAQSRMTYLLTYSCVDMGKFPYCAAFAKCVLDAFENRKSSARVVQWAVCKVNHSDGVSKHCHIAVKLSVTQRWLGVLQVLRSKHNLVVNFSSEHCGYVAAYRHLCKVKPVEEVLHSEGQINLETVGSPSTKNAMRRHYANASKRKSQGQSSESSCKPKKPKRLTNIEVSKFLVANKIRTETELMVFAKERNDNGEGDIYSFIMNKSPKALSDLIHTT